MKTFSKIVILLLLCSTTKLFSQSSSIVPSGKFDLRLKLMIADVDSTGGTILIMKNGAVYKTIRSDGTSYNLYLDFNAKYLISCAKKGFGSKVVSLDTTVPKGREKEEFALFVADVELFPESNEQKAEPGKLAGKVFYDSVVDDFNYSKE